MRGIEITEDGIAKCIVCGLPVPDYKPEFCCDGHECGCYGLPIEPPICSILCDENLRGWGKNGTHN